MATTTLILGAGFGGIVCATNLRRLLPKEHRIVLVDRSAEFYFGAAKTWLAIGEIPLSQVVNRKDHLAKRGIELVKAEITAIDAASKSAKTTAGEFKADYLVIALGADYNMGAVPGLESAETYYALEGAIKLRETLEKFEKGSVLHLIPRVPFKCPPGPYEGAFLIHDYFRRKNRLAGIRQSFYTAEGAPMATVGPEMGAFMRGELEKRSISYHPSTKVTRIDAGAKQIVIEGGEPVPFDLLIAVPPHEAPKVLKDSGLLGPSGWIPADPKTLAVKGPERVYAIGDCAGVPLPGRFKQDVQLSLPKAGILADKEAQVVAANIARDILDEGTRREFEGKGFCYIELGDMHASRGDGDFYRMPNPTMERSVADMKQFQDKKAWVADWLKEHLG